MSASDRDSSDSKEDAVAQDWYDRKTRFMRTSLGEEHEVVMHALFPYAVGGALDLYYYPHGVPGTAIATKELSDMPNEGSSNDEYQSYELVMFTRHALDLDSANDDATAFGRAHTTISAILNLMARYSAEATLNPNETCEFPPDMEQVGGKCLIFDGYARHSDALAQDFGLLAVIEIFRSEMEFAQEHGGAPLIARLRDRGFYPYSDLDRDAVV